MERDRGRQARVVFAAFLCLYFLLGSFLSTKVGLGIDEAMEQQTFAVNIHAAKGLARGEPGAYDTLLSYKDRYYGIGFHVLAWPVQKLAEGFVEGSQGLEGMRARALYTNSGLVEKGLADHSTAFLIAKHPAVFVLFFLSAILAGLLVRHMTGDDAAAMLFVVFYLLYPLLLGHGLMNVKDMPFLFGWMLCTCLSLFWGRDYLASSSFSYGRVVALALCTAWLVSVRFSGFLIFVQYAATFLLLFLHGNRSPATFLKYFIPRGLVFLVVGGAALVLSYPVLWRAPWLLWDAVTFMSRHPQPAIMIFFGKEVASSDLPWFYIPVNIALRLPLLIVVGIFCLPDAVRPIMGKKDTRSFYFGTLLSSCLLIPLILIGMNAHLYDDLRQILFLVPLFCILGYVSLHRLSRVLTFCLTAATAALFAVDNFMMFPYQYSWFSEAARSVSNESDYWGLGAQRIAGRLLKRHDLGITGGERPACLYTYYSNHYKSFFPWESVCILPASTELKADTPRPFLIGYMGFKDVLLPAPSPDCTLVLEETSRWTFKIEPVFIGRVFYCGT